MRNAFALALLLSVPAVVEAQAFVRASAGVTGSTDFVKDFLVEPIAARQSIAPTAIALLGWRLPSDMRLGIEGRVALGTYEVRDRGVTDDLGTLRTLAVSLVADGPLRGAFRWEAAAGRLMYQPERNDGVFSGGNPSPWLLGAGLTWHRPLGTTMRVVAGARYDYHSFSTNRLDSDGYSARQTVHRVGISLGVERGF